MWPQWPNIGRLPLPRANIGAFAGVRRASGGSPPGLGALHIMKLWRPIDPERSRFVSEFVEPVGKRVLVRKDESRQKTRGGIVLPDAAEIPTITGRVVEVSVQVARDEDFPIRKYDKILFHPKNAIPVDFEPDNVLFVVPIDDVVAVFRPTRKKGASRGSKEESLGDDEIRETDGLEQD
jgi:chaperonin GroES